MLSMISLMRRTAYTVNKFSKFEERQALQSISIHFFHTTCQPIYNEKKETKHVSLHAFEGMHKKQKETFLDVIRMYVKEGSLNRGHVEFIRAALKYMDEFGVNKDLEVYKALLDVFPKGKYIPNNVYQAMFHHYPKQQDTAVELLTQMEHNRVMPDREMESMLLNIFGIHGAPLKKFWRMMYWMPKFAHLNPWPLPKPEPTDPREIAKYAMLKLSSTDVQTRVILYDTKNVEEAVDDTWIISVMSKSQQELLAAQPTDKSLFVEGPFNVWIAGHSVDYFVLKGNPIKRDIVYMDTDDVSNLKSPFRNMTSPKIPVTIHEQDDGVYYAMCATGVSSKDSLLSWIRCLQKTNPILEKIPITFKLRSPSIECSFLEGNQYKTVVEKNPNNKQFLDKGK